MSTKIRIYGVLTFLFLITTGVIGFYYIRKHEELDEGLAKKVIIAAVISLIAFIASSYQYLSSKEILEGHEKNQTLIEQYIERTENDAIFNPTFEYGDEVTLDYPNDLKPIDKLELEVDTSEVGESGQLVSFEHPDFGMLSLEYTVTIEDTQPPVIEGVEDITITRGQHFAFADLGITAKDPIDGDVEVSFKGRVRADKVGQYQVFVHAEDNNGNETRESFIVTVEPDPNEIKENPARPEPKPKPKPEPKPESKPEVKPETKPDPAPAPEKPQPKPEPTPEVTPEQTEPTEPAPDTEASETNDESSDETATNDDLEEENE